MSTNNSRVAVRLDCIVRSQWTLSVCIACWNIVLGLLSYDCKALVFLQITTRFYGSILKWFLDLQWSNCFTIAKSCLEYQKVSSLTSLTLRKSLHW